MQILCYASLIIYTGFKYLGRGAVPPWVVIHNTDKVEEDLMVLFFGLVFFRSPLLENFLPTPLFK